MKLGRVSVGVLLLLVGCAAVPSPTAPVTPFQPTAAAPPTASPLPSVTLPPTWTPLPLISRQPSQTPALMATGTATPTPSGVRWPPAEIPAVTLTPTRGDAVPPSAQRLYRAAQSSYAVDDLTRALGFLDQALAVAPDHSGILALRGRVLASLSMPLEAEADLRLALGIDPFQAPARQALAELYAQYGRLRDAAAEFTRYLTLVPDDPEGWYALGRVSEEQSRPAEATSAYSRTLELAPTHVGGLASRAGVWRQAGNYPASWSDYTALLAVRPSADAYELRGEINLLLEAPLMAAADFQASLSLQRAGTPTYTLMMRLGHAYLLGGAADQAAVAFRRTISLTTALEPRIWLGESYLAAEDYSSAAQVFSNTLALATPLELGPVLVGRGRALLGSGDYEGAAADFSAALLYSKTVAEQAVVLEWRSASFAALKRFTEAIADLTAANDLLPSPRYLYQRGVLHQAAGDDEAAIADLTAFVETTSADEVDPALLEDSLLRLEELTAESS